MYTRWWHSPRFFLTCLLPALAILVVLSILFVDYPLAEWIRNNVTNEHKKLMWLPGRAGRGEPWAVLVLIMLVAPWLISRFCSGQTAQVRYWQIAGLFTGVTILSSSLVVTLFKYFVGRPRPNFAFKIDSFVLAPLAGGPGYASFPSGHSQTAWAGALALGFLFPRVRIPLYILALLACLNRIGTNRHYVSDTLAGYTVALGCMVFFLWVFRRRNVFRTLP